MDMGTDTRYRHDMIQIQQHEKIQKYIYKVSLEYIILKNVGNV